MGKLSVWLLLITALILCGCDFVKEQSIKSNYRKHQVHSANNLKQIGQAIWLWAEENDGALPQSFSQLSTVEPELFVAPYDTQSTPAAATAVIFPDNSSYAYLVPPLSSYPDSDSGGNFIISYETPVAMEKPWLLPEYADSVNILFADGHVETIPMKNVSKMNCEEIIVQILKTRDVDPLTQTAIIEKARTEDGK